MRRALIVKKKWLDKIFDEGKVWEMRTTRTNIRGEIDLIESGSGLIVGKTEIIGCSDIPIVPSRYFIPMHKVEDLELIKKWKWAWILKANSAKRYDKPIPYKHPKGAVIWVKHDLLDNDVSKTKCTECGKMCEGRSCHDCQRYW